MLSLKDLKTHMEKYKDAVFIIGPGIDVERTKPDRDLMAECYTRKSLIKTPTKFWNFFKEYIFVNPMEQPLGKAMEILRKTVKSGFLIRAIIDQNTTGRLQYNGDVFAVLELHGNSASFKCKNCDIDYPYPYYMYNDSFPVCEVCGKPLRPNLVLFGENYDDDLFGAVKSQIENTHTLVLVGMDYTEDTIADLIAQYCAIKDSDPTKERMAVAIGVPEDYDPNKMLGFFEFIVRDNPDEAIERLFNAFKA